MENLDKLAAIMAEANHKNARMNSSHGPTFNNKNPKSFPHYDKMNERDKENPPNKNVYQKCLVSKRFSDTIGSDVSQSCNKRARVDDENDDGESNHNGNQAPEEGYRNSNWTIGDYSAAKNAVWNGHNALDEFKFGVVDDKSAVGGGDDEGQSDSDIPEDEIDAMPENGLKNSSQNKSGELTYENKRKIALKTRTHDHFDILPKGWVVFTNGSGKPVYLHERSRVCTMAKPYFLGAGSACEHEIPISAIPCFQYRPEVEKEKLVERLNQTWANRGKHQLMLKHAQRPSLPESTKLLSGQLLLTSDEIRVGGAGGNDNKRGFVMNPNGKSHVSVLQEYVQRAIRTLPRYEFKELENSSSRYVAKVVINDIVYGTGYGSSKKQAKSEAARVSLEILITKPKQMENLTGEGEEESRQQEQREVQPFFDEVGVEDPRISELCAKAGQPLPYQLLLRVLECLNRNYGATDAKIKFEWLNHKNEFKLVVGKHSATVVCKNKSDGKQRASQAILQKLHPRFTSWGSLLRLYGKDSGKTLKEKNEEKQGITDLKSNACLHRPNMSILNKMKEK